MNIQGWFPSGLSGLISCNPRDSQGSSPAPQFESITFLLLNNNPLHRNTYHILFIHSSVGGHFGIVSFLWLLTNNAAINTLVLCCVESVAQSCPTLCHPTDCKSTRLLCPWDSPGKNTGVGCHALLQGIFLTQGSNPCLLVFYVGGQVLSHWCPCFV